VQGDDRATARVEPPEGCVDQFTVGERGGRVGLRGRIERVQLDLNRSPTAASQEVEADVHDQAMQPGLEPVGIAKSRQIAPGADERLLDRIARELRVPKDQSGGGVQPRKGRVDQAGEGIRIAPPRALDELSLVHSRLDCGATTAVAFDRV